MRRSIYPLLFVLIILSACRAGADVGPESEATVTLPATPATNEAARLLEQGKALLDDDECDAALEPLQRAAQLDPTLPEAFLSLGNAYARTGQADLAITALELDEAYAAAHTNLGAAYLRQADGPDAIEPAIEAFRAAIALEPEDADTHTNLGSALLQMSQFPQAQQEFEEALRLDPELPEAMVGLGYVFFLTGKLDEGQAKFEAAAAMDPDMPEVQFALGISYLETSQPEKAAAAFEAFLAIEIPPGCKGDQNVAAEALQQAETILDQLRGE